MVALAKRKYELLWYTHYPNSGLCKESNFILVFKKYKNFYKIYAPPDDFILNLLDNKDKITAGKTDLKKVYLLNEWQIDLIDIDNLIL